MRVFHHVLGVTVLAFLVCETAAEMEDIDLFLYTKTWHDKEELKRHVGDKTTWRLETYVLKSDSDFKARHGIHKGKVLAIYFGINEETEDSIRKQKVYAAREFAEHNVENGIFLYVPYGSITENLLKESKIIAGDLWLDLKDKFLEGVISSKVEYEKRHETYKGRSIFIVFKDPDQGEFRNCEQSGITSSINTAKGSYQGKYVFVVWLEMDVKILGKGYVDSLCPLRRKPDCYPRMYRESSGRVTEVFRGFKNFEWMDRPNWPCHEK